MSWCRAGVDTLTRNTGHLSGHSTGLNSKITAGFSEMNEERILRDEHVGTNRISKFRDSNGSRRSTSDLRGL